MLLEEGAEAECCWKKDEGMRRQRVGLKGSMDEVLNKLRAAAGVDAGSS